MLTGSVETFNKGRSESQEDELMYKHANHQHSLRLAKLARFKLSPICRANRLKTLW